MTVLPGWLYPNPINDDDKSPEGSFMAPDAAPDDVPAAPRAPTGRALRRGRVGVGRECAARSVREGAAGSFITQGPSSPEEQQNHE